MSLKAFHIFFIVVSTILAFSFGAWSVLRFMDVAGTMHIILALLSFVGGAVLVGYGIHIRKKLRQLGLTWNLQ